MHYYEHDNANVHRGIHELSNRATNAFEAARARAAKFINARSADEIIFTRGTTEGINLVAQLRGAIKNLKAGDVILLTEMEHHSNLVPWQLLARAHRREARVTCPSPATIGLLDLTALDELLTTQVKLFAMTHISNSLGTINPVAELCARARKLGITTLVDAAQSAGHRPLDVQEIGCDFLAFSGHKICGPTGIGVLVWPAGNSRSHAAVSGRRRNDSERRLPEEHLETRAAPVRGRHAGHFRRRSACTPPWIISTPSAAKTSPQHDQELGAYAYAKLSGLKDIRLFGPTYRPRRPGEFSAERTFTRMTW